MNNLTLRSEYSEDISDTGEINKENGHKITEEVIILSREKNRENLINQIANYSEANINQKNSINFIENNEIKERKDDNINVKSTKIKKEEADKNIKLSSHSITKSNSILTDHDLTNNNLKRKTNSPRIKNHNGLSIASFNTNKSELITKTKSNLPTKAKNITNIMIQDYSSNSNTKDTNSNTNNTVTTQSNTTKYTKTLKAFNKENNTNHTNTRLNMKPRTSAVNKSIVQSIDSRSGYKSENICKETEIKVDNFMNENKINKAKAINDTNNTNYLSGNYEETPIIIEDKSLPSSAMFLIKSNFSHTNNQSAVNYDQIQNIEQIESVNDESGVATLNKIFVRPTKISNRTIRHKSIKAMPDYLNLK